MKETLKEIELELYNLNNNFENFLHIYCEINGFLLEKYNSEYGFKLTKNNNEVKK